MINCPECNKEVSDQAKSCPNCGYVLWQNNKHTKRSKLLIIVSIFIAFLIVITAFFIFFNKKNAKVEKVRELLKNKTNEEIVISDFWVHEDNITVFVKFSHNSYNNDFALINLNEKTMYLESDYEKLDENDYSKIIEYGDLTLTIFTYQDKMGRLGEKWTKIKID